MTAQIRALFGIPSSTSKSQAPAFKCKSGIGGPSPTSTSYSLSSDDESGFLENSSPYDAPHPVFVHSQLKLDLRSMHVQPPLPVAALPNTREDADAIGDQVIEMPVAQGQSPLPILVLGLPGSGKSIFIKQVTLRYGTEASLKLLQESCRLSIYCRIIDLTRQALQSSKNELIKRTSTILRMRLAPLLALEGSLRSQILSSATSATQTSTNEPHSSSSNTTAPHVFAALAQDIQALLNMSHITVDT